MKQSLIFSFILASVAFTTTAVSAQETSGLKSGLFIQRSVQDLDQEKREEAALAEISARVDRGVQAGFRGRDALRQEMESELKKIIAVGDDPSARAKAITAYQQRYAASYRDVLKSGGVDLVVVAREMSAAMRGMNFSVIDGTHIIGEVAQAFTPPPPPPPKPAASQRRIRGSDMDTSATKNCALASSGEVSFRNNGAVSKVWTAVAGRCTQTGDLSTRIEVLPGLGTSILGTANVETEAFAIGLLAWASASATVSLSYGPYRLGYMDTVVFAPYLWTASETNGPSTIRLSYNHPIVAQRQTLPITVTTKASSFGLGGVAGSNASASVRDVDVTVSLAP